MTGLIGADTGRLYRHTRRARTRPLALPPDALLALPHPHDDPAALPPAGDDRGDGGIGAVAAGGVFCGSVGGWGAGFEVEVRGCAGAVLLPLSGFFAREGEGKLVEGGVEVGVRSLGGVGDEGRGWGAG